MPTVRAGEWGLFCLVWGEKAPALRKLRVPQDGDLCARRTLLAKQPVDRDVWADEHCANTARN